MLHKHGWNLRNTFQARNPTISSIHNFDKINVQRARYELDMTLLFKIKNHLQRTFIINFFSQNTTTIVLTWIDVLKSSKLRDRTRAKFALQMMSFQMLSSVSWDQIWRWVTFNLSCSFQTRTRLVCISRVCYTSFKFIFFRFPKEVEFEDIFDSFSFLTFLGIFFLWLKARMYILFRL